MLTDDLDGRLLDGPLKSLSASIGVGDVNSQLLLRVSRRLAESVESRHGFVALLLDLVELRRVIFPDDVQAISMFLADLLQLLLDGVAMDPTVAGSRQFGCERNLIRPKVDVNKQKTRSGETKALTFSSVKLRLKIGDLTFFGRKSLLQLLVLGTNGSSFGLHKLRPVRRQGATPEDRKSVV